MAKLLTSDERSKSIEREILAVQKAKKLLSDLTSQNLDSIDVKILTYYQILIELETREQSEPFLNPKPETYWDHLKLGYLLEEIENRQLLEEKCENLGYISIKPCKEDVGLFCIKVDDLDEHNPWINKYDIVVVQGTLQDSKVHQLMVADVARNTIYVQIKRVPNTSERWKPDPNHRYTFTSISQDMRNVSSVISLLDECKIAMHTNLPIPVGNYLPRPPDLSIPLDNLTTEQKDQVTNMRLDRSQTLAVRHILNKNEFWMPYLLLGPPGTGKTHTIVEAVIQILQTPNNTARILLVAPSNTAANVLAKGLLDRLGSDGNDLLYRHFAAKAQNDAASTPFARISYNKLIEWSQSRGNIHPYNSCKVLITTLGKLTGMLTYGKRPTEKLIVNYSYIFVDEAGFMNEVELAIVLRIMSLISIQFRCQLIMAGDPWQLRPVVKASNEVSALIGRSALERLIYDCKPYQVTEGAYQSSYVGYLKNNYRSDPIIVELSNWATYNFNLVPSKILPQDRAFPILFHEVENTLGHDSRRGTSIYNRAEAEQVCQYVEKLLYGKLTGYNKYKKEDVAVLTFYVAQRNLITVMLKQRGLTGIDVSTIEAFQGREAKVTILTTAKRALCVNGDLGHISSNNHFNVSTTRAEELLIVVGNSRLLMTNLLWQYIIAWCQSHETFFPTGTKFEHKEFHDNVIKFLKEVDKRLAIFAKNQKVQIMDLEPPIDLVDPDSIGQDHGSCNSNITSDSSSKSISRIPTSPLPKPVQASRAVTTNRPLDLTTKWTKEKVALMPSVPEVILKNCVLCPYCGGIFVRAMFLEHVCNWHNKQSNSRLSGFNSKNPYRFERLSKNLETKQKVQCDHCKRFFGNKWSLTIHLKSHCLLAKDSLTASSSTLHVRSPLISQSRPPPEAPLMQQSSNTSFQSCHQKTPKNMHPGQQKCFFSPSNEKSLPFRQPANNTQIMRNFSCAHCLRFFDSEVDLRLHLQTGCSEPVAVSSASYTKDSHVEASTTSLPSELPPRQLKIMSLQRPRRTVNKPNYQKVPTAISGSDKITCPTNRTTMETRGRKSQSLVDQSTKKILPQNRKFNRKSIYPRLCETCGSKVNNRHTWQHHGKDKCEGKSSKSGCHSVVATGELCVCKYEGCGKTYRSKNSLYTHHKSHKRGNQKFPKKFTCDNCQKSYTLKSNLKKHIQSSCQGHQVFKCEYCDKVYANKAAKSSHLKACKKKQSED